jgi:RecA-family ATPase
MMMFGAAGAWKTMNSTHLAFCIARGESWFGYDTSPATVFIHQVELPKLLARDRVVKYAHGVNSLHNLFFKTPEDDVLLDTSFGLSALSKDIEEVKRRTPDQDLPVVVILDPLYLHMVGHISDEYEVKKFQRNTNHLRKTYGATFIIIHHSRLTKTDAAGQVVDLGAEEIMGSSYWNNWLDTIIRVKITNPFTGSDTIHFTFDKHRNAQHFLPGFKVKWHRETLTPEIIHRDIVEEEPTIRELT